MTDSIYDLPITMIDDICFKYAHLQSPRGEQLPQRPCFHSPWPPLVSDSPQPSPAPEPFPILPSYKCKNVEEKKYENKIKVLTLSVSIGHRDLMHLH